MFDDSADLLLIVHVKDLGQTVPDSAMRQSPYASNAQVRFDDPET